MKSCSVNTIIPPFKITFISGMTKLLIFASLNKKQNVPLGDKTDFRVNDTCFCADTCVCKKL